MTKKQINLADKKLDFVIELDDEIALHFEDTILFISRETYESIAGEEDEEDD